MSPLERHHTPPRLAKRFLKWYCKPELYEDISGDIQEDFNHRFESHGARSARLKYILDVIRFFRPFAVKNLFKTQINNSMFTINSKIALRNLSKHRLYSFINITGLALGIAACLVIAHYVIFQLSFDKEFTNSDYLYRVHTSSYQNGIERGTSDDCGFGLGYALRRDIPEFQNLSLIHEYENGAIVSRATDSLGVSPIHEQNLLFVEPDFLDMFSIEFVAGAKRDALNDPMSIVITQSIAEKYFGSERGSAVGKNLRIMGNWGIPGDFRVSGIVKDFPANSHLSFDFLLPLSNVLKDELYRNDDAEWGWTNFMLYVQLIPQSTESAVEEKLAPLMRSYRPEQLGSNSRDETISIQSISDIYLQSEVENDNYGDISSIYFLVIIGLFILVIAWINFINLSTAKSTERSREVGVKKAMGATNRQLVFQFLTESFWINLFSVLLGTTMAFFLIPELGRIIGEDFTLDLSNTTNLLILLSLLFLGPLIAGFYPAFFMSAFDTIRSLKGRSTQKGKTPLRKILVISQFTISTLMIAGTFAVSQQLKFMRQQNTGIDMTKILVVKGPAAEVNDSDVEKFRNDISSLSSVENFTSSRSIPGAPYNWGTGMTKLGGEKSSKKGVSVTFVDHDFLKTYEIELLVGRDFTDAIRRFPNPDDVIIKNGVVINEATLQAFEIGDPNDALNEKLVIGGVTFTIRGVVKNHNWKSLHSAVTPGIFMYTPSNREYFSLRLNSENLDNTLSTMKAQYSSTFPNDPFNYFFLDDFFNQQYKADREFGQIFNAFALFAVIASCLGLFGLTAFSILQKSKEIGIRKVLGAKMANITFLFSKNYLGLILIANILALPIIYFGVQYWLQDFAFKISISVKLFIIPVIALMLIALITITFQTIKVARANPVKSLRAE